MHLQRLWRMRLLCVGLCLAAQPAAAITIQVNYTYDTGNFFGNGNPSGATAGAQAKAALEAAASFYSAILTDSFSVIQTPAPFHSSFDDVPLPVITRSFGTDGTVSVEVKRY